MVSLIIDKIIMMFLIMMLGVICYKKNFLDEGTSVKLSNFLLMIVNPVVFFLAVLGTYGVIYGIRAAGKKKNKV